MITYPVDVENTKWAILRVSTGEIVGRNRQWPVADGSEIPGLDPDYVYLLHINNAQPDYDSRLYTLSGSEVVDADANEIRKSWVTEKRSTEEQISSAENEEASRLANFLKVEREVIETRLMVGAILSYVVDNQQFPPKVRAMAQSYITKSLKVWKNRDRLDSILKDIEAGREPDLDSGWEAEP